MLWPREEFHTAYNQIKHDSIQHGGCSILILVAMDVDALCACEILTRLFKSDFMSYSLQAVRGYDDVRRITDMRFCDENGQTKEHTEIRSFVLLNCGAIVNLMALCPFPRAIKCYVLDSHRPIHLANVYDPHQQIIIFDDGALDRKDIPEDGSDLDIEDLGDSSDEDNMQDSEEESADKEAKEEVTSLELQAEETSDADHEKVSTDAQNLKKRKRKRREEILRYYRGSYYAAPVSTLTFELAQQLNACHCDLIWYAIIGLTKQFNMEQIDMEDYNAMIHFFQDEVFTIEARGSVMEEGLIGEAGMKYQPATLATNPAYDSGKITFEEEYRFMLYRHWSLYDSMYYSDYIASKLGLYTNPTSRRYMSTFSAKNRVSFANNDNINLHVWLARMGFSLKQSRQMFMYMPLGMKKQLREKTHEMAHEFGLNDLCYGSFKRHFAFQYQLSAADAVYGLEALMEAPPDLIGRTLLAQKKRHSQKFPIDLESLLATDNVPELLASVSDSDILAQQHTNTDTTTEDLEKSSVSALASDKPSGNAQSSFWQQNFILAHTAISSDSVAACNLMECGIQVAMEIKQAIVRVGISIIERKLVRRVRHFRYVSLAIPGRDQELFWNPNILTRLGLFLLAVHRASGKWANDRKRSRAKNSGNGEEGEVNGEEAKVMDTMMVPLIMITQHPSQQCFTVIGIPCPATAGQVHRKYVEIMTLYFCLI